MGASSSELIAALRYGCLIALVLWLALLAGLFALSAWR